MLIMIRKSGNTIRVLDTSDMVIEECSVSTGFKYVRKGIKIAGLKTFGVENGDDWIDFDDSRLALAMCNLDPRDYNL